MQIRIPKISLLAIAAAVKTASLDGGGLRLYQNDYAPNADSVLASFDVATFSGYANKVIAAWGPPYIDASGNVVSLAGLETFAHNGGAVSNLIYGAYYLDAGGALVWAGRFTGPIGMAAGTDALPFVPRFLFGTMV